MFATSRHRPGYTLIELAIVVTALSIFSAAAITYMSPSVVERLKSVARAIADDMSYARSLAVANNTLYRFTFDRTNNLYYLEHTGTTSAFNTLPPSAIRSATDTATRQTIKLDNLLGGSGAVRLQAIVSSAMSGLSQLEFRTFGETTATTATTIWLASGTGKSLRYLSLTINPTTGLTTIGDITASPPTTVVNGIGGTVTSGS